MDAGRKHPYMGEMSLENLWNNLVSAIAAIPRSELLIATIAVVLLGWIGAVAARRGVRFGGFVRGASTLALVGILVVVVLQLSRLDPRLEVAVPQIGLPEQIVEGGETRIPLARDGHFWLRAEINGAPANFLVDTGATLTAVSSGLAQRAGLEPRRGGLPVTVGTANGPVAAQLATADELRFGNVSARGLDVVIAPSLGETNVVGMNLLSRLASWRVEGNTMILVPNNPQAPLEVR
ncbi:TIGR02281 family clan AA aspartic protease [Altererythrobacter sp. GH1-8]|uniref:retropepsin-like aspartic protease family protein n=1 Tax=Altererythrobacter sp. GH1-8 TaxID=3349333 RepID=UPI00374D55BF